MRQSKSALVPHLPGDFGEGLESIFEFVVKDRKLYVAVASAAPSSPRAIESLVERSADVPCDAVCVSVPKSNVSFADWMRRLLYAGFTVSSKRDSWSVPVRPGAVACVLDLSDRSSTSSSSGETSVLTDDDSSDSDSDASDDGSWLDDDDD